MPRVPVVIRWATEDDIPVILDFLRRLAEFDGQPDAVEATPDLLRQTLFGDAPMAGVMLAEIDGAAVGFAYYQPTYSTFLGRPGLWLDDLFVLEDRRGRGIGTALKRWWPGPSWGWCGPSWSLGPWRR